MIDSYGNDFLTSLAEGTPDSIVLDNDIIIKDAGQFAHNLCGNFTCYSSLPKNQNNPFENLRINRLRLQKIEVIYVLKGNLRFSFLNFLRLQCHHFVEPLVLSVSDFS